MLFIEYNNFHEKNPGVLFGISFLRFASFQEKMVRWG